MEDQKLNMPTEAQIEAWKKKYGDVFQIEILDKVLIVRRPNRNEMGYITKQAENPENALPAVATVFQSCYLAGDKEVINDDRYFIPASKKIADLVDYGEAAIKKL